MAEKIYNIPLYANIDGTPIIVLDPQSIPTDTQSTAKSKNFINSGTAKQQHLNIINDLNTKINSLRSQLTGKLLRFPDYNKGVAYTASNYFGSKKENKFTIPYDGWLFVRCGGDQIVPVYFINHIRVNNKDFSHAVAMYGTGHANHSSIFVPVKKNDFFTCSTKAVKNIIMYPLL